MTKIFIDIYADMLNDEATANNIIIAPSRVKKCRSLIDFKQYDKKYGTIQDIQNNINKNSYKIIPLSMQDWLDYFIPYLQQGNDIVFFTISQRMMKDGGADLQSAFTKLSEEFPNQKCYLVDTKTISRGTSEIAMIASALLKSNSNIDEIITYVNEYIIGTYVSAFVADNIDTIQSTPLLSDVLTDYVGSSVGMRPILCIDTNGDIKILKSVKGFKSAVNQLYGVVADNGVNIADYTFTIVNFNAQQEADKLYNKFRPQVEENEIRNLPIGLNNAIVIGGRVVGITFHSKK